MTQQHHQQPSPPTYAELASTLLATHAALGRIPPTVFKEIPESVLARLEATVRQLDRSGWRPQRAGRDPLMDRIRAALKMDGPPQAPPK